MTQPTECHRCSRQIAQPSHYCSRAHADLAVFLRVESPCCLPRGLRSALLRKASVLRNWLLRKWDARQPSSAFSHSQHFPECNGPRYLLEQRRTRPNRGDSRIGSTPILHRKTSLCVATWQNARYRQTQGDAEAGRHKSKDTPKPGDCSVGGCPQR